MSRIGEADKFMIHMLGVPDCAARFQCLSFQKRFPGAHKEICGNVALLEQACDDVKGSARLKKLLSIILKLGNKLNSGSNEVSGFTLDSLMKLKDAKVKDARCTHHFLTPFFTFPFTKYFAGVRQEDVRYALHDSPDPEPRP